MNITLRIADELGKRAKHLAVDEGKSLSAVVTDLLEQRLASVEANENDRRTRAKAWELIQQGISGGGEDFDRESMYERKAQS